MDIGLQKASLQPSISVIKRVLSKVNRIYNDVFFNTSSGNSLLKNRGPVSIMYHGIDVANKNPFNVRHTPVHFFDKQVHFLTKHYSVVSPAEFFDESMITDKPKCLITFDDGYKNNLDNALPVLLKYKAKATVFITGLNQTGLDILCADFVGMAEALCKEQEVEIGDLQFVKKNNKYYNPEHKKYLMEIVRYIKPEYDFQQAIFNALDTKFEYKNNQQYDEYWKIMNDEELKKLANNSIITIGCHGYYHTNLGAIKRENIYTELTQTKQYLEGLTQKEVDTLAYPFGLYSTEAYEIAKKAGLKYQLLTETYNNEADRTLPDIRNRAGIYHCDTAANQLLQAINNLK